MLQQNELTTVSLCSLQDTYGNAIQRIKYQQQGYRDLAIRFIAWLTYSKSLLSTTVIRQAFAINEDLLELAADFAPDLGGSWVHHRRLGDFGQ